jgi:hypothetical protein
MFIEGMAIVRKTSGCIEDWGATDEMELTGSSPVIGEGQGRRTFGVVAGLGAEFLKLVLQVKWHSCVHVVKQRFDRKTMAGGCSAV